MRLAIIALLALFACAAAPANAPVPLLLAKDFAVDAPPTWTTMTNVSPGVAFVARGEASVQAALQRVGQRPTDLPYAIVEEYRPDDGLIHPASDPRRVTVERLADYYRTALNPPSKANRSAAWRKSRVSAVKYDGPTDRFRFDATITYDTVGDLHVVVAGQFDRDRVLIFSAWSDDAFDATHPGELAAIRDSFRLVGPGGLAVAASSAGVSARTVVQLVVGLAILAVFVIQLVVLHRDRQARRDAMR